MAASTPTLCHNEPRVRRLQMPCVWGLTSHHAPSLTALPASCTQTFNQREETSHTGSWHTALPLDMATLLTLGGVCPALAAEDMGAPERQSLASLLIHVPVLGQLAVQ